MDTDEIIKRFDQVEADRSVVQNVWAELERYVIPYRGKFFQEDTNEGAVEWSKYYHFDGTALEACDTLAASMQGSLTSPMIKWFNLKFRTEELNDDHAAQMWLDECSDILYSTLQTTNFNTEISETYLDLAGLGNAVLIEEALADDTEELENVAFDAVPIKEAFFEMDENDRPIVFYRKLKWTVVQIAAKFGEENLPETYKERLNKKDASTERYTVIFCVYQDKANKDADISKILASKARPYQAKYVLKDIKQQIGPTYGYYEMPAMFARWRKVSGSIWGHSQGHVALGDIKVANKLKEMILARTETEIDPPMKTTDRGLIGDLNLKARGLNVVRNIDDLQELIVRGNISAGQIELAALQDSIRRAFRTDQLQLKESPAMTATEASIRYELMQRLLGPTLGRLKTDLFDPLIQRLFNILYRAGALPEAPESVIEAGGPMDIEYLGPLPRAQRTDELLATRQWIFDLAQLSEAVPEIMDIPDVDAYARETAKIAGIPAKFTKEQGKVNQERKEREQRLAAAQAAEIAKNQAEADAKEAVAQKTSKEAMAMPEVVPAAVGGQR